MYDALSVNIVQSACKLRHPESNSLFGEAFPRYMESKITTVHEVDNDVSRGVSARPQLSSLKKRYGRFLLDIHVLHVLEAVSQVTEKGVVKMFEHAPLANNIPHALRSDDWLTQ